MEPQINASDTSSSFQVLGITCIGTGVIAALVMAGWSFAVYLA